MSQLDSRSVTTAARLLTFCLICGSVYLGREILIPISLACLIAFFFAPLVNRMNRIGVANGLAVVTIAIGVFITLGAIGFLGGTGVSRFIDDLPGYKKDIQAKLDSVKSYANQIGTLSNAFERLLSGGSSGIASSRASAEESKELSQDSLDNSSMEGNQSDSKIANNDERLGNDEVNPVYVKEVQTNDVTIRNWAGGIGSVFGPLGNAGLIAVLAFFLILYRDDLRDRLVVVLSHGNYVVTTEAIDEATTRIGRFLQTQVILNASVSLFFYLCLLVIGLAFSKDQAFPNALFISVFVGMARFVPYIGPLVGAAVPLALSLAMFPGYGAFFAILAIIIFMELLLNNFVEPWAFGASTGVSTLAVILSAIFWGWLWGPVGLLLATPITTCLVVLGQYVPRFGFFTLLFSDKQQVKPSLKLYQRLLAEDKFKAIELINSELNTTSPLKVVDQVLLGTIRQILKDKQPHDLSDDELVKLLNQCVERSKLLEPASVMKPSNEQQALPKIIFIPSHHPAELLLARLIASILSSDFGCEVIERKMMLEHEAVRIANSSTELVVVLCMPALGMRPTKQWVKSISQSKFEGRISVTVLGKLRNLDRTVRALRSRGATHVFTSITQTHRFVTRSLSKKESLDHYQGDPIGSNS